MAIILTDFDKIWASSSPLTPYSFSDANYEEGWNFVGATPPARQMWDGYMKFSDEKQQYIVNNFLPLAGGTMTGAIVSKGTALQNSVDDNVLNIFGGTDNTSPYIGLYGKNNPTYSNQVTIRTGINNPAMILKPDGTLTWNGQTVIVGTEATESTTISSIGGNATANYTLSHKARYYSITMSGTGYAFMNVTMSTDQQTINVYNTTSTARSNIGLTVRYIY